MANLGIFATTSSNTKNRLPAVPSTRDDIIIRKHARDRYRDRISDITNDVKIDQHITYMLINSSVATLAQKRSIENTCSHDIRNNYLYNNEYEQYVFGDLVICVVFKEQVHNQVLIKTRHVITLYYL